MTFAAVPFAEGTFAGLVGGLAGSAPPPVTPPAEIVIAPFTVEIDGVSMKTLINSLSIDHELGRQSSASFTLYNVTNIPVVGNTVRILWYSDVLFAGMIDRITVSPNDHAAYITYQCDCVDYSYLLFRRKMQKTYNNVTWTTIAIDVAFRELFSTQLVSPGGTDFVNDGVKLGRLSADPSTAILATVDIQNGNAHDLLSGAAAAVGGIFYVGFDKTLNIVTPNDMDAAPNELDDTVVEEATLESNRETYRNRQTVIATGTPLSTSEKALVVTYTRENTEQIDARRAIEGGTGIYNEFESITHPSSNDSTVLLKFAMTFALLRLGTQGSMTRMLRVRTRASGFKAGQLATVTLSQFGLDAEEWIIQKASMREEDGMFLITTLELTSSTLVRRAQELWLEMVKKSEITVIPSAPATSPVALTSVQFTTPGTTPWVVPANVFTIQLTCLGPGGGGGGGAEMSHFFLGTIGVNGGRGGNGGRAVSVISVTPGETLSMIVPSGGAPGTTREAPPFSGTHQFMSGLAGFPSAGTVTEVRRGFTTLVSAATGGGGGLGFASIDITDYASYAPGTNGSDGNGGGQFNTVGGGSSGGLGGKGLGLIQPTTGNNGVIIVEY